MTTDNEFDEFISIISMAVAVLLTEQENGGKVLNILDKEDEQSVHCCGGEQ